jgi:PKHD-type hydroxylase
MYFIGDTEKQTIDPQFPLFVYWDNLFTSKQVDKIIEYCDNQEKIDARVMGQNGDKGILSDKRKTKISWINRNESSSKFIDPMIDTIQKLNHKYYNFNITHFFDIQYTVYGESESKYDYHIDSTFDYKSTSMRKLSSILMLSDKSEYEGGQFYLNTGTEMQIEFVKGRLIVFPSFVLHRVAPIKSGVRKTLVTWICGPLFR